MDCALTLVAGGRPVKLVRESLGVSRSQLTARIKQANEGKGARRRRIPDDTAGGADQGLNLRLAQLWLPPGLGAST